MNQKKSKLRSRAEAWVRAEFQFRCGPQAYQDEPTRWFMRAERQLRRAISGCADLREANKAIGGVDYDPAADKRKKRTKR